MNTTTQNNNRFKFSPEDALLPLNDANLFINLTDDLKSFISKRTQSLNVKGIVVHMLKERLLNKKCDNNSLYRLTNIIKSHLHNDIAIIKAYIDNEDRYIMNKKQTHEMDIENKTRVGGNSLMYMHNLYRVNNDGIIVRDTIEVDNGIHVCSSDKQYNIDLDTTEEIMYRESELHTSDIVRNSYTQKAYNSLTANDYTEINDDMYSNFISIIEHKTSIHETETSYKQRTLIDTNEYVRKLIAVDDTFINGVVSSFIKDYKSYLQNVTTFIIDIVSEHGMFDNLLQYLNSSNTTLETMVEINEIISSLISFNDIGTLIQNAIPASSYVRRKHVMFRKITTNSYDIDITRNGSTNITSIRLPQLGKYKLNPKDVVKLLGTRSKKDSVRLVTIIDNYGNVHITISDKQPDAKINQSIYDVVYDTDTYEKKDTVIYDDENDENDTYNVYIIH